MSCGRRSIWPFGKKSTSKPCVAAEAIVRVGTGNTSCNEEIEGILRLNPNIRMFSFNEIKSIRLVGRSGVTILYKGSIRDDVDSARSIPVAVKKLNCHFYEEMEKLRIIGRPHLPHPNLEKFLGFGWNDGEMFLVYEFMHRGCFKDHLSPPRGSVCKALTWDTRLKIVMGAARGLEFLHSSGVFYKETFKASDILLDKSYNAKLSDRDLAIPIEFTRFFDGYDAPEYGATGRQSKEGNVYNFGVVLVQVLTGGQPLNRHRPNHLVKWSEPEISDKLRDIMDPHMRETYCLKSAVKIALLAQSCLQWEVISRPSMEQVVQKLDEIIISK